MLDQRMLDLENAFGTNMSIDYPNPMFCVPNIDCNDSANFTQCVGLGISKDDYGSFLRFKCLACGKEEIMNFNFDREALMEMASKFGERGN